MEKLFRDASEMALLSHVSYFRNSLSPSVARRVRAFALDSGADVTDANPIRWPCCRFGFPSWSTRFGQHMFHADVDGCVFIHDRFSFVGSAQDECCAVPKNECKCRGYKPHGHANARAKSIGQDNGKVRP